MVVALAVLPQQGQPPGQQGADHGAEPGLAVGGAPQQDLGLAQVPGKGPAGGPAAQEGEAVLHPAAGRRRGEPALFPHAGGQEGQQHLHGEGGPDAGLLPVGLPAGGHQIPEVGVQQAGAVPEGVGTGLGAVEGEKGGILQQGQGVLPLRGGQVPGGEEGQHLAPAQGRHGPLRQAQLGHGAPGGGHRPNAALGQQAPQLPAEGLQVAGGLVHPVQQQEDGGLAVGEEPGQGVVGPGPALPGGEAEQGEDGPVKIALPAVVAVEGEVDGDGVPGAVGGQAPAPQGLEGPGLAHAGLAGEEAGAPLLQAAEEGGPLLSGGLRGGGGEGPELPGAGLPQGGGGDAAAGEPLFQLGQGGDERVGGLVPLARRGLEAPAEDGAGLVEGGGGGAGQGGGVPQGGAPPAQVAGLRGPAQQAGQEDGAHRVEVGGRAHPVQVPETDLRGGPGLLQAEEELLPALQLPAAPGAVVVDEQDLPGHLRPAPVQGLEEDVVGAHVQVEEPLLVEGPEAV